MGHCNWYWYRVWRRHDNDSKAPVTLRFFNKSADCRYFKSSTYWNIILCIPLILIIYFTFCLDFIILLKFVRDRIDECFVIAGIAFWRWTEMLKFHNFHIFLQLCRDATNDAKQNASFTNWIWRWITYNVILWFSKCV